MNYSEVDHHPVLKSVGRTPEPYLNRKEYYAYTFSSGKRRELTPENTSAFKTQFSGGKLQSLIFVRVHSIWYPRTVSSLRGENVLNYKVLQKIEVSVCQSDQLCRTNPLPVDPDKWLETYIPVPSVRFRDRLAYEQNNTFAIDLYSHQIGSIVSLTVEKLWTK